LSIASRWRAAVAVSLVFIAPLGCSAARAADWEAAWEGADSALLLGALATLAVDWHQTRKVTYVSQHTVVARSTVRSPGAAGLPSIGASANPSGPLVTLSQESWRPHNETNPLLGTQPSNAEINRYFLFVVGGTVGLSYVLPNPYRRFFLGGMMLVETRMILRNDGIGLRMNF
jgi:hypothetical protein